jgi:uncharacterized membrane protein YkvA (DUF1232 family)
MNSTNPSGSAPQGWSWTHLLRDLNATWRLLFDPNVPTILKTVLPLLAFLYWVWPIDLMPMVPFDDIAVVVIIARIFVALAPRDSVDRAFNGGNWRQANPNRPPATRPDDPEAIETTWRIVE